jgi:hypothetical protein
LAKKLLLELQPIIIPKVIASAWPAQLAHRFQQIGAPWRNLLQGGHMSRRFAGFPGALAATTLLLGAWTVGFCLSPNGDLVPRRVFLSDNKLVGRGSHLEQACRHVPALHDYFWPLLPDLR